MVDMSTPSHETSTTEGSDLHGLLPPVTVNIASSHLVGVSHPEWSRGHNECSDNINTPVGSGHKGQIGLYDNVATSSIYYYSFLVVRTRGTWVGGTLIGTPFFIVVLVV